MYTRLCTIACFSLLLIPSITLADELTLYDRISDLEKILHKPTHNFTNTLNIKGVVELEAFSQNKPDNNDSDTSLATVEVSIEAQINPWTQAHILLLHEDGEDQDLVIDEGFIAFSFNKSAIQVTAGKQVLPFARFESHMISDPLTLEMAETNDSAVITRFEGDEFHATIYFFKGDIQQISGNENATQVGAHLGYVINFNELHIDFGVDYLNDLSESEGFLGYFENADGDPIIQQNVPGVAVNTLITVKDWHAIFEYVSATREYDSRDLVFGVDGAQPSSFNAELSHNFVLSGKDVNLAFAIQGSNQALNLELPKQREMVSVSYALQPQTSLAVEYMHASRYHPKHGGSDTSSNVVSLQLAAQF
mgnify:CR=1 FL=1